MKDTCILEFLSSLEAHNSRDWLLAHKEMQREAASQFEELVQRMITELSLTDPSIAHLKAGDLTFRLNRDTRFSKDCLLYTSSSGIVRAPQLHIVERTLLRVMLRLS